MFIEYYIYSYSLIYEFVLKLNIAEFQITFTSTHSNTFLFVLGQTGNNDAYFLQRQKGKFKMLEMFELKFNTKYFDWKK